MQTNLRSAKSLHLHATGRDFNGELFHNGSQDISLDLKGSPTGDPNEAMITSGEAGITLRSVGGVHYFKANPAFWKFAATQNGASASSEKINRFANKWIKTPSSMTSFNQMSMPKLIAPLLSSDITGPDGVNDANTTVSADTVQGTSAWKLTNMDGVGQIWVSQKTGEILELKYGSAPSSDTPINDFIFSDMNKSFSIPAPSDVVTP